MSKVPSLSAEEVSVSLRGERIFEGVSFNLKGPGLVIVLGPNGAGKTTLFKALLGLIPLNRGRVIAMGDDVTGRPEVAGRYLGYVPQLNTVFTGFPVTVREFIEASLTLGRGRLIKERLVRERVETCLRTVGAMEYADRPVSKLSGGQLQRVLIARALVRDPPVLLMDEPTSAIDPKGKEDVIRLIAELSRDRMILLSTHDPAALIARAREVMVFNRGIRALGPPSEVFRLDLIREVYGGSVYLIEKCIHIL